MPIPFPGMDPWLEGPMVWRDVHNRAIALIADHLGPLLLPKYFVRIEERNYMADGDDLSLVGIPDQTVATGQRPAGDPSARASSIAGALVVDLPMPSPLRETFLEIVSIPAGRTVTAIEILSPTNKRAGAGKDLYDTKRQRILQTRTHLVEIDLLRSGERPPVLRCGEVSDYRILVSRSSMRPKAHLYPFGIRDRIPLLVIPLDPGDEEPTLDLGSLLSTQYDRAGYGHILDYARDPIPPLPPEDAPWADQILREAGVRS